ncbi:decarboxylase [Bacillus cereus]|uniref:pyridoxal phosphate-dependent decarboxylase family protein n=1 Tax=Bacillus cereus TaxID=1396 RepID=UPI001C8E8913|nr:pyridoxal-dependent decarboxylase [Bacillus cereus]MBY0129162.1 decarboxylase [Bacillus cereus]
MFIRKNMAKERIAKRLEVKWKDKKRRKTLDNQESLEPRGTSLESWFMGPKAENQTLFQELVNLAVGSHCDYRREYFPSDPSSITKEIKQSLNYQVSVREFKTQFSALLNELNNTPPFHSYRWHGHMNGDLTIPSMLGYFAGMLYNPNNVASEASPASTLMEMEVGEQLCRMLGYYIPESIDSSESRAWGHITCDGSVANLESMWAARNLKYYPISLAEALKNEPEFQAAKDTLVSLLDGKTKRLVDLDVWSLLNLKLDEILEIPERIKKYLREDNKKTEENTRIDSLFNNVMNKYTLQKLGMLEFHRRFLVDVSSPVILGPVSMHYSWPKSAAVLGIGAENIKGIYVDLDCRMEMDHLRAELEGCLVQKRPVIMVVSVIGSTEESAVDPLVEILALREEYRSKGLEFLIHADAAWGGYYNSLLEESKAPILEYRDSTPALQMSQYVTNQYKALRYTDSITIDPHKSGFVPYPAGALCYRNSALRNLISFTAPVVYHGGIDPTVGVYGIEGSKPGAAAVGIYLSHNVIGTDRYGYGQLLGKAIFNSKRFYAALLTMAEEDDPFFVVPIQRLPAQKYGGNVDEQIDFIRKYLGPQKTNEEITSNQDAMDLLYELGSDHNIITYIFSLKPELGQSSVSLDDVNKLNQEIFLRLSVASKNEEYPERDNIFKVPMIVTASQFQPEAYGEEFMNALTQRMQVDKIGTVDFLISTTTTPFLTDTFDSNGSLVLLKVIQALRETVLSSIKYIKGK